MPLKNPKYIFISGGVLSSLGKGITTSSLAMLLQAKGYAVTVVKCENYLNIDSGLINPLEHGDAFLCEDGTETDMDLGNYERFLGKNLGSHNFVTMGQIYKAVIDRERENGYGGEDIEAIPHVTDEIISRIKMAAEKDQAEICLVELGGTAGEYQNVLYYEASRIMKLRERDTVVHVHVSYLPTPAHVGEPKTKPTQLSVKQLNAMSIQPDFLVTRTEADLDERRRDRLALFCNMHGEDIIMNQDLKSIYEVPLNFHKQGFDTKVLAKLGLDDHNSDLVAWEGFVTKALAKKSKKLTLAIVGKYFKTGDYNLKDSYHALFEALDHASIELGVELDIRSINSAVIEQEGTKQLEGVQAIIVPIGWGARGTEGKIMAIKYAREHKIPYLGLCYGLQLASIEYARNVVGLDGASSTEIDPNTKYPIVHDIPFDPKYQRIKGNGVSMRLGGYKCILKEGTLAHQIYGATEISERHRHRYEFNNDFRDQLTQAGFVISGTSPDNFFVEMIELSKKDHPFFLATQAHPEYKSRPLSPHPVFLAFLQAAVTPKV
ncbi:CTP synthase [Candidatus Woesebacteria bacterium]|nr:CTP synthase [Candidatus Woesebacteria bacterium]